MDLRALSKSFAGYLQHCVANPTSSKGSVFTHDIPNGGEVIRLAGAVLPPSTRSCLSEFTGPLLQTPTVILASPAPPEEEEEESPELKPVLEQFSNSVLQEEGESIPGEEASVAGSSNRHIAHFCLQQTVIVGKELSRGRVYLNQQTGFHSVGEQITKALYADLSALIPLPLSLARLLCSCYSLACRKSTHSLPALWVPCQDDLEQDKVFLGCSYTTKNSKLNIFCITQDEIFKPGQKVSPKQAEDRKRLLGQSKHIFTEYDLVSSSGNSSQMQSLSLQFAWEDPSHFLCPPPQGAVDVVLRVAVEPGTLQALQSMYTELETLLAMCEAVCGSGEWGQEGVEVVGGSDLLSSGVEGFIAEVNAPLSHSMQINVVSPTIEGTLYKPRENFDFTEQLWMFVKDTKSFDEIQETMGAIFKALLLGKAKNVALHESSLSSLAELLRELNMCRSPQERQAIAPRFQLILSSQKILQFLAEIGCEKLKRDLRGFLISTKIATGRQCNTYFQSPSLIQSPVKTRILQECHSLCNLYHVVELTATLISYHCFSTPTLSTLAQAAMDVYSNKPFKGFKTTPFFHVPISGKTTGIIEMCSSIAPKMWVVSSRSANSITVVRERPLLMCEAGSKENRQYRYTCTCYQV